MTSGPVMRKGYSSHYMLETYTVSTSQSIDGITFPEIDQCQWQQEIISVAGSRSLIFQFSNLANPFRQDG